MNRIAELQKIGVRVFGEHGTTVDLAAFIPIFHRWIQSRTLDGVLVDVADYRHMSDTPRILLIAHEANYSIERMGDRMAFACYRKQRLPGDLSERLTEVTRQALRASLELERAPELEGGLRFPGNELEILASDRLLAPNTEDTHNALTPALDFLTRRLFPGVPCETHREEDPGERLAVALRAGGPAGIGRLLESLGA